MMDFIKDLNPFVSLKLLFLRMGVSLVVFIFGALPHLSGPEGANWENTKTIMWFYAIVILLGAIFPHVFKNGTAPLLDRIQASIGFMVLAFIATTFAAGVGLGLMSIW